MKEDEIAALRSYEEQATQLEDELLETKEKLHNSEENIIILEEKLKVMTAEVSHV